MWRGLAAAIPAYPGGPGEDWQLAAGIPLGLFGAVVVTLLAGFIVGSARLFARLKVPDIAKSVLGGVIFGVVGVALPLTMFNGSDQLKTLLSRAGTLGLRLLAATLIAKMLIRGDLGGPYSLVAGAALVAATGLQHGAE
jgi:hypothetical protein